MNIKAEVKLVNAKGDLVLDEQLACVLSQVATGLSLNSAVSALGYSYSSTWRKMRAAEISAGAIFIESEGTSASSLTDDGLQVLRVFMEAKRRADGSVEERQGH